MAFGLKTYPDTFNDVVGRALNNIMTNTDIWGQTLHNGDFVVSASKSSETMVMGVLADVKKQTRIRVDKDREGKWYADDRPRRMYTLSRTLKISDEMILDKNPELFEKMIEVREALNVPTNAGLKAKQKALREFLENGL